MAEQKNLEEQLKYFQATPEEIIAKEKELAEASSYFSSEYCSTCADRFKKSLRALGWALASLRLFSHYRDTGIWNSEMDMAQDFFDSYYLRVENHEQILPDYGSIVLGGDSEMASRACRKAIKEMREHPHMYINYKRWRDTKALKK